MSNRLSTGPLTIWRGILPIVSVPFKTDASIDYQGFCNTLQYIGKTSCFGMLLFGIASEFYKLSDYEKNILVRHFIEFRTKKKKIISITDHSTKLAIDKAKKYESMGIDGLMLLPPFFLQPQKEHVIHHIESILTEVSIPVILQVAPGETGFSYSTKELLALHRKYPNLIFKIEGSPIPDKLIRALTEKSDEIHIFNGYAGIYMPEALKLGCRGIMPGCSFTELYETIYALYSSNEKKKAVNLHRKFISYIKKWMVSCEYIIAVEKYILMKKGIISTDVCRKPAHTLDKNDHAEIAKYMSSLASIANLN